MTMYRHLPPSHEESDLARISKQRLSRYAQGQETLTLQVLDATQDEAIELPASAVALLVDILDAMASGQGITLIPENAELTTVQAADMLRVSRPYLIKLLKAGALPYRMVGTHRRILLEDVVSYKQAIDQEREQVLDQLVAEAQEQNMGYE